MEKFSNVKLRRINNEENISLVLKPKILHKNRQIYDYISFVKICSTYGVIVLHLNNFWIFNLQKQNKWIFENLIETTFYYSVPFFVLCIGATLVDFNERYGLFEYNKRRFIKVFIPLIGWTCLLYLYKLYILKSIPKIPYNFVSIWNYFFSSKIYFIFSSLHTFLLTYMLIPLLAYIEKSYKIRILIYYFFLFLVTQSFIPYLISLFGNRLVWKYKIEMGFLIYIFAGYIIHNHHLARIIKIIIYSLGICSFFIHLIGTKILTFKYKTVIKMHKGYLNLPCILYSCALFLFIKENFYLVTKIISGKYINKLGSLTLGPFFMHLAVRDTIYHFSKLRCILSFNIFINSLTLFTICIVFSYILKKIPLFNHLVP